ncbi:hypothetical protein N781_06940 [Pontibacillus halophilus JSM 076056 = DSM 19796]|uniref:Aminoglycoside phosphotransferase domain-containing protein n=1 Tax=Pontibacillus halophilus JSM 076056 = DSM 19796 TaxID=1385510 RepID=A0A0A5GBN4_9BACI|nr:aminoglycoside phosphotransferase family protein [Pontibacillus halophilus]KGX90586.1 hypothetical protein N781_06940 [Pontibacillus halophilus JSM 076056 = DSM 19796]
MPNIMNRPIEKCLGDEVKNIEEISRGYSHDYKWHVTDEQGKSYFAKASSIKEMNEKKEMFELLEELYHQGVQLPKPINFISDEEQQVCVQLFEWIEGTEAERQITELSKENQYDLGVEAGKQLKAIHRLRKRDPKETWFDYRMDKYKRYQKRFKEVPDHVYAGIPVEGLENFIKKKAYLMTHRPVVFMHDDYHLSNLLVKDEHLAAIVDFDRYEWGDPHHEFYKLALFSSQQSPSFSTGQIHGYFEDDPLPEFWTRYSLYAAMVFKADLYWSYQMGDTHMEESRNRLLRILEDHDGFTRMQPKWFG